MQNFITDNVKIFIVISILLMSLCIMGIICLISYSRKTNKKIKEYDSVNGELKEHKKNFFDYSKIEEFLVSNGAVHHYPWMAEPVKFISASILFGGILALVGSLINIWVCALGFCIGAIIPYILISSDNKKDNNLILEDIKLIYNVLYNQIKAGVYISDALTECSSNKMIKNKRMAIEMKKLASDIYLTSDVSESLDNFTKKFNNIYVTSLGIVIKQSLESGMASEALQDITEQLKEVEKNLLILKRERKSFRNFIFQLMFLMGIVVTMFAFIFPQITSIMGKM